MKRPYLLLVGFGPGNGLAIARAFQQEGLSLALLSRNPERHEDALNSLAQGRDSLQSYPADASEPAELRRVIERVMSEAGGPPEVLVYNAALMSPVPILEIDIAELAQHLAVDALGALACAQPVIGEMQRAGRGTVLLTGGGFADQANRIAPSLSLGKLLMKRLAEQMRLELEGTPVRVGTVTIAGMVKRGSALSPEHVAAAFFEMYSSPDGSFPSDVRVVPQAT